MSHLPYDPDHEDHDVPAPSYAAATFARLEAAVRREDYASAKRETQELLRLGWVCTVRPRRTVHHSGADGPRP